MSPKEVAVRFSLLKNMALSPAHYLAAVLEDREDKPHMRRGRAVHTLVLGGPPLVVWKGERRQGNAWKDFEAEHAGEEILTVKEYDNANRAAEAVRRNPLARELLTGEHEVPLRWQFLGRTCETRGIDVVGERWVTELKTGVTAAPWRFPGIALRLHYHAQTAWYQDALATIGRHVDCGYIVAVEQKPPYAVTTFEVTSKAYLQGKRSCRLWLEHLLTCEESGDWPDYVQSTIPLDVPDSDEDFALQVGGETIGFDEVSP